MYNDTKVHTNYYIAPMKVKKVPFSIRIPEKLLEKIGLRAKKEGRSKNNMIERILKESVNEDNTA